MQKVIRSIHTLPLHTHSWKLLGHMLAQDGHLQPARHAFEGAVALSPPSEGVAARVGLATTLAQLGLTGEAAASLQDAIVNAPSAQVTDSLNEHFQRLARQLMPSQCFESVQNEARQAVWKQALARVCLHSRVLDISATPVPALLACRLSASPVARVEQLPRSTASALLAANGATGLVVALPSSDVEAQRCKMPPWPEAELSSEWVLVADVETADVLGSRLLPAVREAREQLLPAGAPLRAVVPCTIEVHAALVESAALARLNSVVGPVGGLDLGALNAFSQRTRAVRLSEFRHTLLTAPRTVLRLPLDADALPITMGEV